MVPCRPMVPIGRRQGYYEIFVAHGKGPVSMPGLALISMRDLADRYKVRTLFMERV